MTPTVEQSKSRFTRLFGARKTGFRLVNDRPDDDEADDDRQRAEVAGADAVDEGAHGAADALGMADALSAAVERRCRRSGCRCVAHGLPPGACCARALAAPAR